jgi:hypothetical protein
MASAAASFNRRWVACSFPGIHIGTRIALRPLRELPFNAASSSARKSSSSPVRIRESH